MKKGEAVIVCDQIFTVHNNKSNIKKSVSQNKKKHSLTEIHKS